MENLKIKNTKTNEILKNLTELGYVWIPDALDSDDCLLKSRWIITESNGEIFYSSEDHFRDEEEFKEITIDQLRDMVVLKRNEPDDATHTDQDNWKWYIGEKSYCWERVGGNPMMWVEESAEHADLKPIKKEAMKEYLDPDNESISFVAWQREKHSHYKKDVSHLNVIDPYRIADLYDLHPCAEHIMKKSLCAGGRGHKDLLRDIQDIIDTAERWKEMIEEDNNEV